MDSHKIAGSALESKEVQEYYGRLKRICESGNLQEKLEIAEKMAKNINQQMVILLLGRLANDTYPCKMQVIHTLNKASSVNEDILAMLITLSKDSDNRIRTESVQTLYNLASGNISDLKSMENLFEKGHEAKRYVLRIYEQIWESYPEQIIQHLEKVILREKGDYLILKDIINLFGEIGRKYPKKVAEIFERILQNAEMSDKEIIINAIAKFAKNHPEEALQLFFQIEKSSDISSKFIPAVLPLTVEQFPEKTFELLKKLATSSSNSIRVSVIKSLPNFKVVYPEETLEVLFELWKRTDSDRQRSAEKHMQEEIIGPSKEEKVTQEEIRSYFIEIGINRPSKALSFLLMLSTNEDETKRRNALEVTFSLASKAPDGVFSLLEIFSCDSDYGIKESAISSLKGEWNIFSEKTMNVLKNIDKKEVGKLQVEIEKIFSPINRHNPNGVINTLKKLENGNLKSLFDTLSKTASQIRMDKERIPKELLLDGISKIQEETILCLNRNQVGTWEEGLEFLKEFSMHYSVSVRTLALRILPQFLPMNLREVLETLERLAKDEVSQIRVEALEFIIQLTEKYPVEPFNIIKKVYNSQNKYVRTDIAKRLFYFKKSSLKESFLILKEYAEDLDPDVRTQVILSISEYTDVFHQESLQIISKLCLDNNDLVLRAAFDFLEMFMKGNSEDVLSVLENLPDTSNPTVLEKTALLLGNFKEEHTERIIKKIEYLLTNPIGSVRSCAFSSFDKISKYQPEKSLKTLRGLAILPNPEIRGRVIRSIGILSQSHPSVDVDLLEPFLQDEDIYVKIELVLTLSKMGKKNPKETTRIIKRMLSTEDDMLLREAIADAMVDYSKYCPYEAMKILFYLAKNTDEKILRKIEDSFQILRGKMENFYHITQISFQESALNLEKEKVADILEMIVKKTIDEEDPYLKEIGQRYELYNNLLRFSTISRINMSEDLLIHHLGSSTLVDENVERALLSLKNIAHFLGKQNIYAKRDDKIENLKDCLELIEKTERQFDRDLREFDNPDRLTIQSILNAWQEIIMVEFIKLRGKAEVRVILESTRAVRRDNTSVRLKLVNEGTSKAENITILILPSTDFAVIGHSDKNLKILSPNDFDKIEFSIKVKENVNSMRVAFNITFDDAEKEKKTIDFADMVTIMDTTKEYVEIKNPYIPGVPLKTREMFYGRDELLKNIEKTLKMTDRTHILILHGQRRTGKTSILYQLKIRLSDEFIPVYFDFQGLPDSEIFFYWMAREIHRELSRRNITVPIPDENRFLKSPAFYFRDFFLEEVKQKLGHRKLVLMMDEFEAMDEKIRAGKYDRDILTSLRNIMQHYDKMDFIFSGTHQLEEMSSEYWSILFNIGLYYKISFLERLEAVELICHPIKDFMEYDPLAIEKILEMTSGHPFFVQLICYQLIVHQMKKKRNYTTIEDVNDVLNTVVVTGTPHFEYIWKGMTRLEKIVLLTLANVLSLQNVSTIPDIIRYLKQYFFEITEQRTREILEKFLKEEIIEQKTVDYYRFKVELIKLWCEKNNELHKLMEENADG